MAEFASKGVAGAGLGLGIAGSALGLLNGGFLGNLFNGNNATCSENCYVNRYELQQEQKIAQLQSEISLRDANMFTDNKIIDLYKYVDGELRDIRATQNDKWTSQAVINAQTNSGLAVLNNQIADITNTVNSITKTGVPTSVLCNFGSCNTTSCGSGCTMTNI